MQFSAAKVFLKNIEKPERIDVKGAVFFGKKIPPAIYAEKISERFSYKTERIYLTIMQWVNIPF